ncbi:MAG: ribonuclease Y [Gemmatimonadetes bacterium]|nr:ribonuclease Y [Gemmatimonadota bacterium]
MLVTISLYAGTALIMFLFGWFIRKRVEKRKTDSMERLAESILTEAVEEAETIKNTARIETEEESYQAKAKFERESNQTRQDFQRVEKRIAIREQNLERKADYVAKREKGIQKHLQSLQERDEKLVESEERLDQLIKRQTEQLEQSAGMTTEEARKSLLSNIDARIRAEAGQQARSIIEEARQNAEVEAREIITHAMQKYTLDHVTETTTSVISLPDNEMKGRIIGRDGRNIQAFEMSTGIDVIVDDTPNAVVLSGFNPMRREIAKLSMEKLIQDGRIHPGFIEQVVTKTQEEISDLIQDTGEQVLFDLGITGVRPELAMLLGQLKYRMTGGQNALHHCREVAELAGIMAQELDLDVTLARRCGLLHDIGKAVEGGPEGAHGELGRSVAEKYGEPPEVLECIDAIHDNMEEVSPMAVVVRTADSLSMSRPGALREPLEKYVRRLREMERLVSSFDGVSRAFVMKAGKEVRVMIDHEEVDDLRAVQLATEIARKIQVRMEYSGQIKVTVIRQTRAVEIAR